MTVREKGGGRSKEVSTTSTSEETVEVVSSSVVEEARRIVESESRSSVLEVTSASREVVTDSKGNVIEIVESAPSARRSAGKSCQELLASERAVPRDVESSSRTETVVERSTSCSKSIVERSSSSSRVGVKVNGASSREASSRSESRTCEEATRSASRVGETGERADDKGRRSTTVTRDSKILVDRGLERVSEDTIDFAGDHKRTSSSARYSKPGESAWDGTFVIEKTPEPRKRNALDSSGVFLDGERAGGLESARRGEERSWDEKRGREEGMRDSSRFVAEERRRAARPGQSSWNGEFVYEKRRGEGEDGKPRTVVRRGEKRHDSDVDVQDVTEEQNVSTVSESSVSSSYIVEYATATDERRKTVEKASSVSGAILEEDSAEEKNQQSFTDVRDSSLSSVHETIVYDVAQPTRPTDSSSRPGTPERVGKATRDVGVAKPGSSAWDGTFVAERQAGDSPAPRSSKHLVTDATLDVRDATERISKVFSNSIVVEQSTVHHSYSDSSNLDYSTSSVETVIVRDGVPAAVQKSVTIEEDLEKKAVDRKSSAKSSAEAAKSERPSKPGASTWDGSFVPEKRPEKPVHDHVHPVDKGEAPRISPTDLGRLRKDEQPTYVTEKSITVRDASKETSEFVASTTTLVSDTSETLESSKYSIVREEPAAPRREPALRSAEKDRPEKGDRSLRPTKPGASTWDGSFVYEKPQDRSKRPIEKGPLQSPTRDAEDGGRPTSPSLGRDATKISMAKQRDAADKKESTDIDVARSSYVIDQSSSFTSVQDVRDVVEERVIGEFTRDTRKDVVSNE
ncbi:hypothetical protein APICC_08159 [Apis cerana cerana]|uniref:Uncharacterized protein n=1 Tax=Apis cerana cerana TaxID=94128 RepID=A0A2A3ET83_APICC|nr:hypothetical protein APICC_08159 [Apis cerana cerana]